MLVTNELNELNDLIVCVCGGVCKAIILITFALSLSYANSNLINKQYD